MTSDVRPDARYAALSSGKPHRFYDPETGQEYWRNPVGVDDLFDAGASIDAPDEVKLPHYANINPGRNGTWTAEISYTYLRPEDTKDNGVVGFIGRKKAANRESFDTREEAVEWIESKCQVFAEAEIRRVSE